MRKKTERLIVNTPSKNYPIYFDNTFGGLKEAVEENGLTGVKFCVVTDTNVAPLYLEQLKNALSGIYSEYSEVIFNAGEQNKTLKTIEEFYEAFINNRLDRKSIVIALGGGVTGDMAGFAAATYMRGIRFIQIPTTLLAQVDSSVGGKTGVDFLNAKNIIGAFYQPELVYINTATLDTLPEWQFSSGMAEAVKHGLILDENYFNFIYGNTEKLLSHDYNALSELISGSCRIKSKIVSQDEREAGKRELLNFGHTFGHALESLCNYTLPHGHCVAIGMRAAFELSNITHSHKEKALHLFEKLSLPTEIPRDKQLFSYDELYGHMFLDKKTNNNKIRLILLDNIGNAYTQEFTSCNEILRAIKSIY